MKKKMKGEYIQGYLTENYEGNPCIQFEVDGGNSYSICNTRKSAEKTADYLLKLAQQVREWAATLPEKY